MQQSTVAAVKSAHSDSEYRSDRNPVFDLEKLTTLYKAIGDTSAHALVVSHFEPMEERLRGLGGIIVKSIGDSVIAAPLDSEATLQVALDTQHEIAEFNTSTDRSDFGLKIEIYEGAFLAMRSEQGLNFFEAL